MVCGSCDRARLRDSTDDGSGSACIDERVVASLLVGGEISSAPESVDGGLGIANNGGSISRERHTGFSSL